jgi:hypothetical protein
MLNIAPRVEGHVRGVRPVLVERVARQPAGSEFGTSKALSRT